MTNDIPTKEQIGEADDLSLQEMLSDLTRRLSFCVESGLRMEAPELAEALQLVVDRLPE